MVVACSSKKHRREARLLACVEEKEGGRLGRAAAAMRVVRRSVQGNDEGG